MRVRALALVALVVLAGCSGGTPTTTTTQATTTTTTQATTTTTTTTTPTTTATTTTTTPAARNPWGDSPVRVAVQNYVNESRAFTPHVRAALAYWEGANSTYGTYEPEYRLVEDPEDAHLVIRFVGAVYGCDDADVDTTLGCAPVLTPASNAESPEVVRVRGGYTNQTTVDIVKHELGHTRGLRHGEGPMPLMAAVDSDARHFPVTNATDLANPWQQDTLRVYLDAGPGWSTSKLRTEAEAALRYYNDGADGWAPANLTLTVTENRTAADVVVRADANEDFGFEDGGYGWEFNGTQLDSDRAYERYTHATLTLGSVDKDHGEWYVGAMLGYALGAENQSELPPPFANPDAADEEWFT